MTPAFTIYRTGRGCRRMEKVAPEISVSPGGDLESCAERALRCAIINDVVNRTGDYLVVTSGDFPPIHFLFNVGLTQQLAVL